MTAQAVDYYYKGNQNGWSASAPMAVSMDGYYSYAEAKSYADNGNTNNHFKIAKSKDGWDYGNSYLKSGFNNTNITNMGAWDGDGNCCIYHDASYYVLVYHPNTAINNTNNPIICASTTLPYDGDCHLMGIGGDWSTGIKMELNANNKNEFILLDQPINEPFKFKLNNTWTTEVENYTENGVNWVETTPGSGQYNITLPAGNYDFYFKKDIMKVYIARNTVVTTTANPAEGGTLTGAGVYNNDEEVTLKATPNTGYNFVNWTKGGTQVSANATYTFQAAGDVEYVANFELKTYTVKFLNYDGEVLQSSTVNHGETPVYSGKTPEHPADAQYTYTFSGWDNAIAAATSDQTYKAQFNTTVNQYTITVNAENGTVTGAGTYDYGTSVTITATPDTGYEFVNWTKAGVEVSTDASYTFTVTEDVDIVANFAKKVYTRTTTIDSYGTICLPFGSDDYSGAEFYEVAYLVEGTGLWLDQLAAGDQLVAGKPYIFKATATELVVVSNATEVADPVAGANGLTGTFTDIAAGGLTDNYIIAENKVWVAGSGATLSANRAYIDESLVPTTAQAQLPGRRRVQMGENAATGLDNITNGENTVIKTIENGQLIIIRNGEKFNAQGQKL